MEETTSLSKHGAGEYVPITRGSHLSHYIATLFLSPLLGCHPFAHEREKLQTLLMLQNTIRRTGTQKQGVLLSGT